MRSLLYTPAGFLTSATPRLATSSKNVRCMPSSCFCSSSLGRGSLPILAFVRGDRVDKTGILYRSLFSFRLSVTVDRFCSICLCRCKKSCRAFGAAHQSSASFPCSKSVSWPVDADSSMRERDEGGLGASIGGLAATPTDARASITSPLLAPLGSNLEKFLRSERPRPQSKLPFL